MNDIIESRCGVCCKQCSDDCNGCFMIENPDWGKCEVKQCCERLCFNYCGECCDFPCDYYADEHNKIRITQTYNWIAKNIQLTVNQKYIELQPITTSKVVNRIASRILKSLPKCDDAFVQICDELIKLNEWILFQLVTFLVKLRKTVYKMKYIKIFQSWLTDYTPKWGWGGCDILCYRVINPMIENFPQLYDNVLSWASDERIYVRRASAVALINSTSYSFKVHVPFELVETVCNSNISDSHLHIQKGIGWLLKYAYLTYPDEVEKYLRTNVKNLNRTTFRYALEKMPKYKKAELMSI